MNKIKGSEVCNTIKGIQGAMPSHLPLYWSAMSSLLNNQDVVLFPSGGMTS